LKRAAHKIARLVASQPRFHGQARDCTVLELFDRLGTQFAPRRGASVSRIIIFTQFQERAHENRA
jgi:hypothetical protein